MARLVMERGAQPKPPQFTDNQGIFESWLAYARTIYKPNTLRGYSLQIKSFLHAWNEPVTSLQAWDLEAYLQQLNQQCNRLRSADYRHDEPWCADGNVLDCQNCPSYQPRNYGATDATLNALVSLFDHLHRIGATQHDAMRSLRRDWKKRNRHRRHVQPRRVPTRDDLRRLLALPIHRRFLYALLAKTGMRIHEAVKLELKHIEFDHLVIPSGGKRKGNPVCIVDDQLRKHLDDYLAYREHVVNRTGAQHDFLLVTTRGSPMNDCAPKSINRIMAQDSRQAGLETKDTPRHERLRAHGHRHFFSDELKRNGIQDYWWHVLRGDTPPGTQATYIHPTLRDIKDQYQRYAPRL